jgi:hypothetical protein
VVNKVSGAPTTSAAPPAAAAPAVEEPSVMGKVLFLNPESQKFQQLPREQWKRKTKVGWGSMKFEVIVAEERSSLRISSKDKIVFVLKPFPDQQNANIIQRILIYPFEVTGGRRVSVVETQKNSFRGPTQEGNTKVIALDAVRYGTSSFALNPADFHLAPGEYWIFVPGSPGISDPIITFGVD